MTMHQDSGPKIHEQLDSLPLGTSATGHNELSTLVKIGHFVGSLIMAITIIGLVLHLPITILVMIVGFNSAAAQGLALIPGVVLVILVTREFYRDYYDWFEPL